MLAVNGKKIDVNDEGNAFAKEVKKGIEEIKTLYGFPLIFKYPQHFYSFAVDQHGNKLTKPEAPAGKMIRFREMVEGTMGSEEWTYYRTSRKNSDGNGFEFDPPNMIFNGHLMVEKKDADLAFFLMFKSPFVANSFDLKQRPTNSDANHIYMILENKAQEAENEIQVTRDKKKVEYMITADERDGILAEEDLRDLALSYHVPQAGTISIQEVQIALINKLNYLHAHGKRTVYKEFLEITAGSNEKVKIKALAQSAIDKKIIGIKRVGAGRKWAYIGAEENTWGDDICKIQQSSSDDDSCINDLSTVLLKNKDAYETLRGAVESKK